MGDLKNYYEVLEVPASARQEDIYQSYLRAKMAYSTESLALYSLLSTEESRFQLDLVEEAYSILSDPQKRRNYDDARGINHDFLNYDYASEKSESVNPLRDNNYAYSSSHGSIGNSFNSSISNDEGDKLPTRSVSETNVSKLVTQKRFALEYTVDPEFEQLIEDTTEFTGEFLRKIREYKNVSLDRLADMTKVSRLHLQNIEAEAFAKLPAQVYVRGFVFQYAKCLKLKADHVANSFLLRFKKYKP